MTKLVEYLSVNAIVCGVNSNKKHTLLKQELAHFDVKSVFSKCIGAGAMASDKPHPDDALALRKKPDFHFNSLTEFLHHISV